MLYDENNPHHYYAKPGTPLHQLGIPSDSGFEEQQDYSCTEGNVEVIFRNFKRRLIGEILRYPVVLGCVAWLTDRDVLAALAGRESVSIIVQKEDFLRPDLGKSDNANAKLQQLYGQMPGICRQEMQGIAPGLNYCGDPDTEGVRCVGNHNSDYRPAVPRMHNKFLVFCSKVPSGDPALYDTITPHSVWTGSFNVTEAGGYSWENAVIIRSYAIALAYAKEHAQLLALSEELDWKRPWVTPEYRIGS